MTVFIVGLVLILALARSSDANYCVCNSGQSDAVLQKNIDYACGNGADCSAILQNGACFNPNTVKDHCNYAVNSYYQKKGQITGSCDFQGTAIVTSTPPTTAGSGCVYQSSPGGGTPTVGGTGGTPTVGGTPVVGGGTPVVGGTPIGGTPAIGGTPTSPNIGGTTTPGTVPGSTMTPFGMAPTGSGFGSTDNSAGVNLLSKRSTFATLSIFVIFISGLIFPRM